MRTLVIVLMLAVHGLPALARPFCYNIAYGPEYSLFMSQNATAITDLVTCGITCQGNLPGRLNAEFRGGFGEISTTRMSYNEFSLLYKICEDDHQFLGLGPSLLTYENILNKTSGSSIRASKYNIRVRWARIFSPIWGFYLQAGGPDIPSFDVGWLAYFDEYLGDFNVRMGYRELHFGPASVMRGPYLASSIYF